MRFKDNMKNVELYQSYPLTAYTKQYSSRRTILGQSLEVNMLRMVLSSLM